MIHQIVAIRLRTYSKGKQASPENIDLIKLASGQIENIQVSAANIIRGDYYFYILGNDTYEITYDYNDNALYIKTKNSSNRHDRLLDLPRI
ncbi:hypothetical protein [Lentilactobacillus kefiri]|uniref:hypothetical protein n=1 Tax=Lentilactobacillus kefiri TaxID=33962 RepID=UPI002072ED67|nr:hypothetical protein [Lentilactobacillus kefiri]